MLRKLQMLRPWQDEEDKQNMIEGAWIGARKAAWVLLFGTVWYIMTGNGHGVNEWLNEVGSEGFTRGTAILVIMAIYVIVT